MNNFKSSLLIALLAGVSLPALAQSNDVTTDYSVTSKRTGITTTVRSVDLTKSAQPPVQVATPEPAAGMQPILDEIKKPSGVKTVVRNDPPLVVVAQPTPAPAPAPVAQPAPAPAEAPAPAASAPVAEPAPVSAPAVTTTQAAATKLSDILARAYVDSPVLRAEREVLRQQYENVAVAESGRRPSATISGGVAAANGETDPGSSENYFARDIGITGTQYLYRGGRTLAQIEQQLRVSDAAIAAYDSVTQDVFINVIMAAMDIQRERATIELTERNRAVISRSLESAQNGFRVGELTRTDVAQAQARLAGADAQLVASRAAYSSALARLMQYAGIDGTDLRVSDDLKQAAAPASLSAAKSVADAEHPLIRTAIEEEKVAQSTIELAQGALRPDIYAQATAGKAWEPSSLIDSSRDATIGLRASLPLYDGGASRAVIRQAKHQQMEKRDRTSYARRVVGQQVSTAWNDYEAALAQIEARTQQVEASRIARDGVSNERQVGTRTVLDTLNADAELLDAEVGLVSAQRDAIVAAYALQAATGQLTGEKLGLFSRDSEKQRLDKTRKDWFGTSVQSAD